MNIRPTHPESRKGREAPRPHRVRTGVRAGIDTVPLPEMPMRSFSTVFIGTWPTPESPSW